MVKLMEMVNEDVILTERIKINGRKVRLAGIGLVSKARNRRQRLVKQMMEMGDSFGTGDTLIGKASLMGTGAVHLLLEESQRVFDDLVEEGERSLNQGDVKITSSVEKISSPKSVAKTKPAAASKPKAKKAPKASKTPPKKPQITADSKVRLEKLRQAINGLGTLSPEADLEVHALLTQVSEGDVRGRRPAKTKPQQQEVYDARRKLKGMKPEQALEQLDELVKGLVPKPEQEPAITWETDTVE